MTFEGVIVITQHLLGVRYFCHPLQGSEKVFEQGGGGMFGEVVGEGCCGKWPSGYNMTTALRNLQQLQSPLHKNGPVHILSQMREEFTRYHSYLRRYWQLLTALGETGIFSSGIAPGKQSLLH